MAFGRKGDAQLAVRLSGMGSGDRVVDIVCGPGVAVRYAARLGATVTGVDPAPVMLRVARLLTRRAAKVPYVEGTAEAIPLPDGSASIVWSIATVHHWSDLDAGLREVRRVTEPLTVKSVSITTRPRPSGSEPDELTGHPAANATIKLELSRETRPCFDLRVWIPEGNAGLATRMPFRRYRLRQIIASRWSKGPIDMR
jgi:ubiquinone/menaquinone biosynthesis C-methylase UbiE